MSYALLPNPPATLPALPSGLVRPLVTAGWHNFDDIETLTGLAGTFTWPESPLMFAQITFMFNPGTEGFQGVYQIRVGAQVLEQGDLFTVPNNPAIGFAAITLQPTGAPMSRTFIVQGMFTDASARIFILLLNAVSSSTQPVFVSFRIA